MDLVNSFFNILLFSFVSGKYVEDRKCNTSSDCVTNALCQFNLCVCKDNFIPSKTECLEVSSKFGGPCVEDIQCSVKFGARAECQKIDSVTTGKCGCQKHSHFQDGICYESVLSRDIVHIWPAAANVLNLFTGIGGQCLVNDNCISLSKVSTYCYESRCICAPNYESNNDGTDCVPIKYSGDIGSACVANDSCKANHSVCLASICRCEADHVISKDKKRCLPVAGKINGGCEEDTQCTGLLEHTYCNPLVQGCLCLPTARQVNDSCWITSKLGESCNHDWQCVTPSEVGVVCNNKTCNCSKGFKMSQSKTDCIGKASMFKYSTHLLVSTALYTILAQCLF